LYWNFLPVALSASAFAGGLLAFESSEQLDALRAEHAATHVFHRSGDEVACVPLTAQAPSIGKPATFRVNESASVVRRLVQDALIRAVVAWEYRLARFNPPAFIVRQASHDLLAQAAGDVGATLSWLHVYPRYTLDARILHGRRGPQFGILASFKTRWEIDPTVAELLARGLNVEGRYVMGEDDGVFQDPRRDPLTYRRAEGCVEKVVDGRLHLCDAPRLAELAAEQAWLEARRENLEALVRLSGVPDPQGILRRLDEAVFGLVGAKGRFQVLTEIAERLKTPGPFLLAGVERLGAAKVDEQLVFMCEVLPTLRPEDGVELAEQLGELAQLRHRRHQRTPEELALVIRLEQSFKRRWLQMKEIAGQILEEAGAFELVPGLRAGLLELHPLVEPGAEVSDDSLEPMLEGLVARTGEVLADRRAYPLFDDGMGDLIRAGLEEGLFELPARTGIHARQAGAAAGLFEELPTFPAAHVDEVLDIRKELDRPLVRFRSALAGLTERMETTAYDAEFREELHELYIAEVAPAMLEIRELIEQNSYLRRLLNHATQNDTLVGGTVAAGLGVVIGHTVHAPDLLALGPLAIPAAAAAVRAAWEQDVARRTVQQHQFYFLHGVEERLRQ
jgi:hypothetical protein